MPHGGADVLHRTAAVPAGIILAQRGHLFPWVPVALGLGIGLYFLVDEEPDVTRVLMLAGIAALLSGMVILAGAVLRPLVWGVALVCAGLALAATRAQMVAEPVLGWRYYGAVEGRIVGIDRSGSDAVRLTLDRVRLDSVSTARTPARVRLSLHGQQGFIDPVPGLTVITTAHLSPPGGPVEPGGFDFQRHTWFDRLGAIGYTRVPVLALAPPQAGETRIFTTRMALSARIRAALPGETGGIAAALITGDRSGLSLEVTEALRRTNLAHLLAISGLHMGLVAGFVYASLRLIGAAVPRIALNWPVRSMAAMGALAAGAGYLALSGGAIATERAFVMAAVAFVALIADRRAITLRALALAALVVLILRPEALLSPGFQMSFAATTALVAVFALLRGRMTGWPGPVKAVATVVISSSVAGLATAPVGAAHFNMLAHYGLIANLAAVPLMGALVMPAGVLSLVVMPLGLEVVPLTVMGWGLDWVLGVARVVQGWEGAVGHMPAPGPWVLPLYAAGGLMLALWRGPGCLAGVVPLILAGVLWVGAERPPVLIDDGGEIVGVLTPEGRALSRDKGAGFVAEVWLENDGSGSTQAEAAGLWPVADVPVIHLRGKRAAAAAQCRAGEVLVLNQPAPKGLPCEVFDPPRLRDTGAVALRWTQSGLHVQTAREVSGRRLWNDPRVRDAAWFRR
ncbi:ComEC/Rec2 family competence protein [Pseudooceanicola onchidii]|uniref:ComEC/Rec2 family competence protein n=1 Tax=Pseudooceanicola onchidii TaxID=2562279 RepID=UPI001F0D0122|nr:ComEC/Rec2 family competence protein [Pseudooceanicola onchidii]